MTHEQPAEAVVQLDRDDGALGDVAPAPIVAAWLLGDEWASRTCRLAGLSDRSVRLACTARDLPGVHRWLTVLLDEPRLVGWRFAAALPSAARGPDPERRPSASGPVEAL
jgi:hypothetical protein